MLIDLSVPGRAVINPAGYPTTIAIYLDSGFTDEHHPEVGLFCSEATNPSGIRQPEIVPEADRGRHPLEPTFQDTGMHLYLLDRPERLVGMNHVHHHHYLATTWKNSAYVTHPVTTEIVLIETGPSHVEDDDLRRHLNIPDLAGMWSLSFDNICLMLPDYEPGYLTRTPNVQLVK